MKIFIIKKSVLQLSADQISRRLGHLACRHPPRSQHEGLHGGQRGAHWALQAMTAMEGVCWSSPSTRFPCPSALTSIWGSLWFARSWLYPNLNILSAEYMIAHVICQPGHFGVGVDEDTIASGGVGKQLENIRETRPRTSWTFRSRTGSSVTSWNYWSMPHLKLPLPLSVVKASRFYLGCISVVCNQKPPLMLYHR